MQGSDAHPHAVRDGPELFAGPHPPHGPPELLQVDLARTQAFNGGGGRSEGSRVKEINNFTRRGFPSPDRGKHIFLNATTGENDEFVK